MENDKILVEIASYCDPELLNTINSALIQADNPERVCFSVCYQSDLEEDYKKLLEIDNCKVKWLKKKEAKGSCYARTICQKMIDDEKYVFQIDSHMRFVKHWDTKLIEDLLSINDKKAIISFYPPSCDEDMMKLPLDDKQFDNPGRGGVMCVTSFRDNSFPFVNFLCRTLPDEDKRSYIRGVFISAGNFFSFSDAHKEVFIDEDMFFYGDELFMSINLFTHGWNVYSSSKAYVYHHYCRKERKIPIINGAMDVEKNKLMEIIENKNNKAYLKSKNIGNKRTIDEYEKFSGIDFENKIIYLNANIGEFDDERYIGKISYFGKKDMQLYNKLNELDQIEVLIVDLFGDYKECINNSLKNAIYKERVKFIVGSVSSLAPSKEECKKLHIKSFSSFSEKNNYCEILNKLSKKVSNNCYVSVIDSSIRFMKEWDKYICNNIKQCGSKSLLTNWIWISNDNDELSSPYINIVKDIKYSNYYLPSITYNNTINLSDIEVPFKVETIFDGFIFCNSDVLKKIEVDPNLNYQEHKYIYSLRLWTNGIDIYVPKLSYFYRLREEEKLMSKTMITNYKVVDALSGIYSINSETFEDDYRYDIGSERPLWSWYQNIGVNYDYKNRKIIISQNGSDV